MILILGGIYVLSREYATFETARTTITDMAITKAGFSFTVTARAEHIPRTCTVIGLFSLSGSLTNFRFFFDNNGSFSIILISFFFFEIIFIIAKAVLYHRLYTG